MYLWTEFSRYFVSVVAEWYRYRVVACLVKSSSPVPLKTHRVGQRCTLNLSRAETSSRWCDSQATIKTVSGYNLFPSKLEFECKQLINLFLCTGREVVLQWIPSHCGIHRNEQADKLAKEASTLHPPCHPMPLRNAKRILRDKLRRKRISTLTDLAVGKPWSCLLNGQRRAQLSALSRV
ncbi:uncharacterized protein LOC103524116 [Trichonephila clavipes]|nr:uncharacterized protein LOC103524116 [Trichonephila clavipes]